MDIDTTMERLLNTLRPAYGESQMIARASTPVPKVSLAVASLAHDDTAFFRQALGCVGFVPPVAFVSQEPWHCEAGKWQETVEIARQTGAQVIEGEWTSELE